MSVLLITFDLKTEGKDYKPFFEVIKTKCNYWWHYMESAWIVETEKSPDEFAKLLYPHMTTKDRLFVVKITKEQQGWVPQSAWDWLNSRTY